MTTDSLKAALEAVIESARRDMARTQTDFLGRMGQCLGEYQDIFDDHPDGDLGAEVREDADEAILSLAGLALAQLLMLRGFDHRDAAALRASTDAGAEPVAWMYERLPADGWRLLRHDEVAHREMYRAQGWTETPVYAHPPADAGAVAGDVEHITQIVQTEALNGADSPVDYGDAEQIARAVVAALHPAPAEPVGLPVPDAVGAEEAAKLADIIRSRLFGIHPDDQDLQLEDDDWRLILAALAQPPAAEPVASHEVDADGKPTDDSDPWFQLGWHKERLTEAESELATWKERAMSLRLSNGAAEPVGMREALKGVRAWVASLTVTDMNEIVADGGITAGMVVGQEAVEQLRRIDAALATGNGGEGRS